MNCLSRKVFRKVLSSIIIMESHMRRSRIRKRECFKTKRVSGWSRFSFRCHRATNRKKERERERHTKKHQSQSIYKNIENIRYICMKMHEHVVCNSKNIMGSAQSNPTSTQSFQQSKHASTMHETVL